MDPNDELPCRELVELVTDYLEGRLAPIEQRRFEAHLAICRDCRTYLEQMRQTVRALGRLREESIDPETRERLLQVFRAWRRGAARSPASRSSPGSSGRSGSGSRTRSTGRTEATISVEMRPPGGGADGVVPSSRRQRAAVRIQTERLVLREYTNDDCAAVLDYQSDPRYLRFYPWTERDLATVSAWVGGFVARQADEPRDVFQLAITLPAESGRLIGSCGVRVNDRTRREGNIGYELNPEYWAHGYATEAARAMLSYGFDRLGLHRIWAQGNDENTASARVLEKLGMRREAHFREHDYFKGRWWGSFIYAMLDHEWRQRGAQHSQRVFRPA